MYDVNAESNLWQRLPEAKRKKPLDNVADVQSMASKDHVANRQRPESSRKRTKNMLTCQCKVLRESVIEMVVDEANR